MTVKLEDGREVTAWISDEHADDATPKIVREASLKTLAAADEVEEIKRKLLEQAAALGMTLVPEGQVVQPPSDGKPKFKTHGAATESTGNTPKVELTPEGDNRVMDSKAVDSVGVGHGMVNNEGGAYGAGTQAQYTIRSETKASEDLREGEQAEIGMIKGRAGVPTAIPVKRKGKMGETTIRVIETGGDAELQKRFKAHSKDPENPAHSAGYQQDRQCSLCRGSGRAMGGTVECPKCNGTGIL